MVDLMYVLRYPLSSISQSIYDPAAQHHITLAVEQAVGADACQSAEVVHAGGLSHLKVGDHVTVPELLGLLLNARKVVML